MARADGVELEFAVSASQSRMRLSLPAEAIVLPSVDQATVATSALCPVKVRSFLPLASRMTAVLSSLAVTSRWPSGE